MSKVSDAIDNARERIATRAKTLALPCAVYQWRTNADGTETRRKIVSTDGYDLIGGIDPDRGQGAREYVARWRGYQRNS